MNSMIKLKFPESGADGRSSFALNEYAFFPQCDCTEHNELIERQNHDYISIGYVLMTNRLFFLACAILNGKYFFRQ